MSLKLVWLATPLLLVCVQLSEAQQPTRISRIGFLTLGSASVGRNLQIFRERLRELGYVARREVSIIVTTSTASLIG